jgi:hypothetical protein
VFKANINNKAKYIYKYRCFLLPWVENKVWKNKIYLSLQPKLNTVGNTIWEHKMEGKGR